MPYLVPFDTPRQIAFDNTSRVVEHSILTTRHWDRPLGRLLRLDCRYERPTVDQNVVEQIEPDVLANRVEVIV
jgi:hypothetical protein